MAQLAPAGGSVAPTKTWGNKTVIFLVGLGVLLWMGGTRAAPVVTAFLVAVIVYWAMKPSS